MATPIGNREDITLRALRILGEADWIAAEDTRHTRRFLQHHGISGRLIAYHEHNESRQAAVLIDKMKAGDTVALVSEAGTPTVSDPGFRLLTAAIHAGLDVVPVPGVSAAVCALSVSGLPTDAFVFVGFLPRKKGERQRQLKALSDWKRTLIFYESPKRLLELMEAAENIMGDRRTVLCREMTKLHEEVLRGRLSDLRQDLKKRPEIKGECTLLVSGRDEERVPSKEDIRRRLQELLSHGQDSLSEAARQVSRESGWPKRAVYEEALRIKNGLK